MKSKSEKLIVILDTLTAKSKGNPATMLSQFENNQDIPGFPSMFEISVMKRFPLSAICRALSANNSRMLCPFSADTMKKRAGIRCAKDFARSSLRSILLQTTEVSSLSASASSIKTE
jgi:hypothetical protein